MYTIVWTTTARRQFTRLTARNATLAARIMAAVDALAINPRPPGCVKLTGTDAYRIRVGSYRIVYTVDDDAVQVTIIRIAHRGDAYRN